MKKAPHPAGKDKVPQTAAGSVPPSCPCQPWLRGGLSLRGSGFPAGERAGLRQSPDACSLQPSSKLQTLVKPSWARPCSLKHGKPRLTYQRAVRKGPYLFHHLKNIFVKPWVWDAAWRWVWAPTAPWAPQTHEMQQSSTRTWVWKSQEQRRCRWVTQISSEMGPDVREGSKKIEM